MESAKPGQTALCIAHLPCHPWPCAAAPAVLGPWRPLAKHHAQSGKTGETLETLETRSPCAARDASPIPPAQLEPCALPGGHLIRACSPKTAPADALHLRSHHQPNPIRLRGRIHTQRRLAHRPSLPPFPASFFSFSFFFPFLSRPSDRQPAAMTITDEELEREFKQNGRPQSWVCPLMKFIHHRSILPAQGARGRRRLTRTATHAARSPRCSRRN